MKLRELVEAIDIPLPKLTEYALNPNNERGRHKARVFFSALGYTAENYHSLLAQIQHYALDAEITIVKHDTHGVHLYTDLVVEGIARQRATVRVGWLLPTHKKREARVVTLYVREEKK